VGKISPDGIVLELGQQRTSTMFRWEYLEGIVPFLTERGIVPINGSGKDTSVVAGTLDGYLKQRINRLTAGWVAVLLEKSGVIQIHRGRPATVGIALSSGNKSE
jgi:hypothetical protein